LARHVGDVNVGGRRDTGGAMRTPVKEHRRADEHGFECRNGLQSTVVTSTIGRPANLSIPGSSAPPNDGGDTEASRTRVKRKFKLQFSRLTLLTSSRPLMGERGITS
jgi:hypothetical protein